MKKVASYFRSYNTALYFFSALLLSVSVSFETDDLKWIAIIILSLYFIYHLIRVITVNKAESHDEIVSRGNPLISNMVSVSEPLNLLQITFFIFSSIIGSLALLSILYFIYFKISFHYFGSDFFSNCSQGYTGKIPPMISEINIDIINLINGGEKSELSCLGSAYILGKMYIKLFILFLTVAGAIQIFESKR